MSHSNSPIEDFQSVDADGVNSPSKDTAPQGPDVEFESSAEKRLAFQLVFQTLKCNYKCWFVTYRLYNSIYGVFVCVTLQ